MEGHVDRYRLGELAERVEDAFRNHAPEEDVRGTWNAALVTIAADRRLTEDFVEKVGDLINEAKRAAGGLGFGL